MSPCLPSCQSSPSLYPVAQPLGKHQIHLFLAGQHLLRPARGHLEAKLPAPRSPQTSCPMARAAVTTMCRLRDAVSHGNLIIAQKGGRERGGAGLEGTDRKPWPWAWGMHAGSQEHTAYAKWNPGPNRPPWHTENLAQSHSLSCLSETCHRQAPGEHGSQVSPWLGVFPELDLGI